MLYPLGFTRSDFRKEQIGIASTWSQVTPCNMHIDALAFTAMSEKFMDEVKIGKGHPAQPNMMKYAGTEINKRRLELVMAAGGSAALEWDSEASGGGANARNWLRTKANSIEGGTSEVMLNVISKRILDLPGA